MAITEKQIQNAVTMLRLRNSEIDFQRIPMDAERRLADLVRQGKYQEIKVSPFEKMEDNLGMMAKDRMTKFTYMVVASISMLARMAIDGGAVPDDVFDLSDALLLTLSHCTTLEDIHDVYRLAAVMMAKLVHNQQKVKPSLAVERVLNYIGRNIFRKITLDEIADYVELTPTYLCSIFMEQQGISIHQYIQREKIEAACNLLSQTTRSISDIALYTGFQTQSHFAAIFRKWKGMTPREYKKLYYREVF